MKKYILFFVIGVLMIVEHFTAQTADNSLQTKIDVEVHATITPPQHTLTLQNSEGAQVTTLSFVQNINGENPVDSKEGIFNVVRGNGVPNVKISQGYTDIAMDQESITFTNGANSTLELKGSNNLGTNYQVYPNTVNSRVTAQDFSNTSEVSTAYPVLTVYWNKYIID